MKPDNNSINTHVQLTVEDEDDEHPGATFAEAGGSFAWLAEEPDLHSAEDLIDNQPIRKLEFTQTASYAAAPRLVMPNRRSSFSRVLRVLRGSPKLPPPHKPDPTGPTASR